ncbi:hypothetical protein ABZ599_32750 [Streptomyces misionensis]|uniref:hypothetical protein n=1 Tax=Streptomyces misionensis TaxID=67331 RepID=UPI0033D04BC5
MLTGLLAWARREGLIRGHRNRHTECALKALRNIVAHGEYHLATPGRGRPGALRPGRGHQPLLVRAVFCPGGVTDPNLLDYDARRASTSFPAQYLWGPGPREQAVAWLSEHQPDPDLCDYLDQIVLVRLHDGHVDLPVYPGVAAGLPAAE